MCVAGIARRRAHAGVYDDGLVWTAFRAQRGLPLVRARGDVRRLGIRLVGALGAKAVLVESQRIPEYTAWWRASQH